VGGSSRHPSFGGGTNPSSERYGARVTSAFSYPAIYFSGARIDILAACDIDGKKGPLKNARGRKESSIQRKHGGGSDSEAQDSTEG